MARLPAYLKGLNPEQREAVLQTGGPVLVLAGAGSGKTRVITTRIAHLIKSGKAEPGQILGVTFTNKAAAEMRERVAGLVGAKAAKGIVLSTFHSFCVQVLRAEIEHLGYRRNFTISSESDARTLIRRSLEDVDNLRESFDPGMLLSRISMVKSGMGEGFGEGAAAAKRKPRGKKPDKPESGKDGKQETERKYSKWLPEVYERYQSALRAANALDFDDLLLLTLRLWREHPEVLARYQQRFRYVMVDEYQDTNRVQYELLASLAAAHRNLCVVGDDDQSIYSWRGADVGNILSFEKDYPDARVVKLEQNYRSTETVLNAANAVIARNTQRRVKNLWSQLGAGRPIDHFVVADAEQEAKEAVDWLEHIRGKTKASYSDFAVLYRSNQQSRPFELALRQKGIPYVVYGGQEFFDRAEVKDILAYLRLIANARDEAAFLRVVNLPRRGIGDATLHQVHELCRQHALPVGKALAMMLEKDGIAQNTRAGIREFLGLVQEFRRRFREKEEGLLSAATELVDAIDYRGELFRTSKSSAQFEARWSCVEALLSTIADYESQGGKTLAGFLDDSALMTDQDRMSKQERRNSGVNLMTIHSAKGLEFPFVFIAGLEEGRLPHERSVSEGQLEEERRLFYVALTRGQRHVTLFEALSRERYGKTRMNKPSCFLEEIPAGLVTTQVRAARDMVEQAVENSRPDAGEPEPQPAPGKKRPPGKKAKGKRGRRSA